MVALFVGAEDGLSEGTSVGGAVGASLLNSVACDSLDGASVTIDDFVGFTVGV